MQVMQVWVHDLALLRMWLTHSYARTCSLTLSSRACTPRWFFEVLSELGKEDLALSKV